MFTQHVFLSGGDGAESSGWVAWVFQQSAGRASVMFFILSGISLSIIRRRGSRSAADGALRRRGFLLLTGGILLTVTVWPASILQHYGLAFLLAPWLLRLGSRGLVAATGTGLVGGPITLLFARNWSDEVNGIWSGETGSWIVRNIWEILVSGIYPMILWIGFFAFGMALGRLDLGKRRTVVGLLIASTVAAVSFGLVANALADRYGDVSFGKDIASIESGSAGSAAGSDDILNDDSLWEEQPDGSFEFLGDEDKLKKLKTSDTGFADQEYVEHRPADWRELYDVTGHSGHIGWTLQTGAMAVAVLSLTLLLPATVNRLLSPLAWMGSMSLTAYLVHIVLVTDVFQSHVEERDWTILTKEFVFLGLIVAMIAVCSLFYKLWRVGPLEWLLKHFTVAGSGTS